MSENTQQQAQNAQEEQPKKINSKQLGELLKKRASAASNTGQFVSLDDEEKIFLIFDPDNIEYFWRTNKFNNKPQLRVRFHVRDGNGDARIFETGSMTADIINTYLDNNKRNLIIQRKGARDDKNTRYFAFTAD
jgi:hypothetical protein